MATSILVVGETGSGKSTSTQTLNPKETIYINFISTKPLPYKGWKSNYTKLTKDGGNFVNVSLDTMKIEDLIGIIDHINKNRTDIKNVVFDDLVYALVDYLNLSPRKDFTKYEELQKLGYIIFKKAVNMRDDINVIIMTHDQWENGKQALRLPGKALEKNKPEGMFTYILSTKVVKDENGKLQYLFVTNNDGENTLAKSPIGVFEELYIPNDLQYVINKIQEFNN